MEIIADILLAAGALGAAVYCYVLGGRLRAFTTLETGMGGAIAVLSAQVDDMTKALEQARGAATGSASELAALTERAEAIAARLELMVASMHDLPEKGSESAKARARPVPDSDFEAGPLAAVPTSAPAPAPVARFVRAGAGKAALRALPALEPEAEADLAEEEAPKKARFFRRRSARVDLELAE